jgi:hypothetical protein
LPRRVWGDGALRVFLEPWITVRLNGVGAVVPFSPSVSPEGCDCSVKVVVRGSSTTLSVPFNPAVSVAVSDNSSEAGYSCSGAMNEPLDTPLIV